MKTKKLLGIFDGIERAQIEAVACDMGVTPEEAVYALALAELRQNPMLIGPDSPESDHNAEMFLFSRARH